MTHSTTFADTELAPPAIPYDDLPGLRWTRLSRMRRSPLDYHSAEHKRTDTMSLGVALHAVMSGEQTVCAYPGPVRRGKEWETYRDAHRGDIIVTKRELDLVERMGGALLRHAETSAVLDRVTAREVVVQWQRAGRFSRLCKAKIDGVGPGLLVELKSTRDVSDRAFGQQVARLGYLHQAAWYRSGWMATQPGPAPEHVVIAVENCSPFDVRVDDFDHELLDIADREITRLLERLDECERSGVWPGLAPHRGRIGDYLPDWWADDSQVSAITLDGEDVTP